MESNDVITLLAIDDKPDNLITLDAVIRDALPHTRVLSATEGSEGIKLAVSSDPDVILLDVNMPGMDGFEVCRLLKADIHLREIPVVFLTALKADTANRVKALEAGAEGFLSKPLETAELIAQIKVMVKIKAANRSQRSEKERLEVLVAERTKEVREGEWRFRAMFENMASASCVDEIVYLNGHATDYKILDVNPAFERITGTRRQEAVGALASSLYGLGHAPFLDVYSRVAETGEPAEFEAWFEPLNMHLHITVGCPKRGFFSTVFTDISERKRIEAQQQRLLEQIERDRRALVSMLEDQRHTEQTLRESEARFRRAVTSAPFPIMIHAEDGEVLTINTPWTKLTGYDLSDIPTISEWIRKAYGERLDSVRDDSDRLYALDGPKAEGEYTISTRSGDSRIWDFSSAPIGKMPDGRRLVISMAMDVTERKHAEAALQDSEATVRKKLKSIVEPEGDISAIELSDIMDIEVMQTMMKEFYRTTGMLGAVLDLSGKVLVSFGWQDICTKFHRCNPATLRNCLESDTLMTQGVAPGTVKSYKCKNNLWDMVTPLVVGGRHLGNVFFGQFLKENEVPDVELFRAQAQKYGFDEIEYLAALARIPHFNSEAAEAGLLFCAQLASIVTTLNYNAIKQARMIAERERLKEELLALNEDLESKVVERTAALEASNKELESFSYSVSHDLRAPVRHISSFVDILTNEYKNSLPDNAKHYLDRVSNSARQMGILIDDLLDFSRTGRQDLRRSDIDMNAVVQGALEKLRPDLENRNISWKIADLPHVYGDFSLLNQVWINLLENAVKYTRKKEMAKIEVGCARKSESWEFFVRDNGVGFDMQYAHKLYGVFQRLHSSAEFEGTGIGLANVQRIIHKHGGQVRAEGQLDEGATFFFTIPG